MITRNSERGSISPLILYGTVIVCVMGIGGATIGRIVHGRREAQNAADSAALAVGDAIRSEGKSVNRAAAMQLAQRNSNAPTSISVSGIADQQDQLLVSTLAGQRIDTPRFIFDGDANAQARAQARVDQERRFIDGDLTADVVLVLDYSGSMSGQPIATLEDALDGHLRDVRIRLAYSAALFSDSLVGEVDFGPESIQKILDMFRDKDASGGTAPEYGFDKAREFLGAPTSTPPRFVVFVSDGEPNNPASATEGSQRLWDESEPTVMTIHIGASQHSPFMVSVSGKPDNRGDKDYYFPVTDMQSFRRALAQILSKIACPMPPLTVSRIKDPETVTAFLQDRNGNEIKLKRIEDLAGNPNQLGYFYNPASGDISVTIEACVLMRDEKRALVARYNRAVLVQ